MLDVVDLFVEDVLGLGTVVALLIKTVVAVVVSSVVVSSVVVSSGHFSPIKTKFEGQLQLKYALFSVRSVDVSLHSAVCGPQIPFRLHIPINKNNYKWGKICIEELTTRLICYPKAIRTSAYRFINTSLKTSISI
jgi:hypothetical protein